MTQRSMGAAGQQKGRNHEKNQTRPGRRILDPHDHDLPLSWILFYFGSNRDARTNHDRIAVKLHGRRPIGLLTLKTHMQKRVRTRISCVILGNKWLTPGPTVLTL